MDADFSHPPEIIPKIIETFQKNSNCIIVASRYIKGGTIKGWTFKRRMLSMWAIKIARHSLDIDNVKDPMSGFFAFPRKLLQDISFTTKGYKILLELLVKDRASRIVEIPYVFTNRKSGESKMSLKIVIEYIESIWQLYRYGKKAKTVSFNYKNSVRFISKTGRFFTVGASGLLINYIISILLTTGLLAKLWYIEATSIGIAISISSNFILNKIWTFGDRNFSFIYFLKQYGIFFTISALGASVQIGLLYVFVESGVSYEISLLLAVIAASVSNFILNKKLTFKEKIWG
jgi:dolichol-phosphate mannosyltransferase